MVIAPVLEIGPQRHIPIPIHPGADQFGVSHRLQALYVVGICLEQDLVVGDLPLDEDARHLGLAIVYDLGASRTRINEVLLHRNVSHATRVARCTNPFIGNRRCRA